MVCIIINFIGHYIPSDQQIEIINQSDFLVFENNISFSGRKKNRTSMEQSTFYK